MHARSTLKVETSAPPSSSVCVCVGRRACVFKACTSWCAPPFKAALAARRCVCVQGCRRRVDTRCLGPPHTFSSVQFPPPYVRHFYSTPSSHHLNLSQWASGARAVNTKSAAAKTRFLMSGGGGGGLPFQPLSRRSESVGVCVALKYSFAQRRHTMTWIHTVCARRPLFRWMKTLLTWKIALYCWLNAPLNEAYRERRAHLLIELCQRFSNLALVCMQEWPCVCVANKQCFFCKQYSTMKIQKLY
jgi:hypothetical protein